MTANIYYRQRNSLCLFGQLNTLSTTRKSEERENEREDFVFNFAIIKRKGKGK